jgi:hypothetical protein
MVSERKRIANRLNAQKSTGPRTEQGKAASSHNALTHGLTTSSDGCAVLPSEDEAAYEQLLMQLEREQRPVGVLQREIVGHIAQVLWRLRRVPGIERSLVFNRFYWAKRHQTLEQRRYKDHIERDLEAPPLPDLPMLLAREFDGGDNGFARLELYRQRLQRELRAAMRELRKLKEEDRDEADDTPPPRSRGGGGGEGQEASEDHAAPAGTASENQPICEATRNDDRERLSPPPSRASGASGEGESAAARFDGAGENARGKNEATEWSASVQGEKVGSAPWGVRATNVARKNEPTEPPGMPIDLPGK